MHNQPLLSICIPTYNRSHYLRECLDSILIQLSNSPILNEKIEVVVSDNCSTDDTSKVAESFRDKFKHFKYTNNSKNIGFDLNVLNVIKNASGKYCWYLGDDDVIINGALEFVNELLLTDTYDIVCIAAEPLTNKKEYTVYKKFSIEGNKSVDDSNDYYFGGYCQGGFSVLMFNREMWMSLVRENDSLTWWLYYETVLRVLAVSQKKKLFISQPGIQTGQDCRWVENGGELFTFVNSNMLMERMIGFGFDKNRIEKNLITNSKKIIIILVRAKGHDLKCNVENLRYLYKNLNYVKPAYLFIATLIYFIPNSLIRILRDSRKNIRKFY